MSRLSDIVKRLRGDALVRATAEEQGRQLEVVLKRLQTIDKRIQALDRKVASININTFGARLDAIDKQLAHLAWGEEGAPLRAKIDRSSWGGAAQSGELDFHKTNVGFRANDEVWHKAVDDDWRAAGYSPEGWEGKTVLDVGAGSRLRSLWFKGAEILVVEPLADKFRAEVKWQDLDEADELYSVPGEEFVPELEGRADLIVSINALDHGYDIAQSIANIKRYLKPDGEAFLSFDMHDEPDFMHPLVLNNELILEIYREVGLEVVKNEEARRYHGTEGPMAQHYWLKLPA